MHRIATRSIGAELRRVPPITLVALVALLVSIAVVEVGIRDPGPGMLVSVPTPGLLAQPIEQLRSVPLVRIDDPRAAAVASGVIFGRTDHVTPADEQTFLDSGLWHLLTRCPMARTRRGQCATLEQTTTSTWTPILNVLYLNFPDRIESAGY